MMKININNDNNTRRKKVTRFTYATKEELKRINKKNVINKMNRIELMERLVQYKLSKWEKRNPCPIKQDQGYKDLFEDQFLPQWKESREEAEKRLRGVVTSMYSKILMSACVIEKTGGCKVSHVPLFYVKDKVNIERYAPPYNVKYIQKLYKSEIEKADKLINKLTFKDKQVTGIAIANGEKTVVLIGHFRAADTKCVCIKKLYNKTSIKISCNRGSV